MRPAQGCPRIIAIPLLLSGQLPPHDLPHNTDHLSFRAGELTQVRCIIHDIEWKRTRDGGRRTARARTVPASIHRGKSLGKKFERAVEVSRGRRGEMGWNFSTDRPRWFRWIFAEAHAESPDTETRETSRRPRFDFAVYRAQL